MSQQLDLWGMRLGPADAVSAHGVLFSGAVLPVLTSADTIKAATRSYLVPWFEALALASAYKAERSIASGQLAHVLSGFGAVDGHSFASWWREQGFVRFGQGITDVEMTYPTKRLASGQGRAHFKVSLELPADIAQAQMVFLVEHLRRFQSGQLSSSPMLWHSFKCALTVQRLCLYLRILRAVAALPQEAKHKILTVGKELNLVPKQRVGTYDLAGDRADKQKAIVHLTYDYFQKGRALVINAARGDFPNVTMPKEFVKTRRPSRKLTAKQYERWEA